MIYRISEFADKCGVNKETIRYYERKNLLQEPHRTEAGFGYIHMMTLSVLGLLNEYRNLVSL